jgi:YHS domain-containing protein
MHIAIRSGLCALLICGGTVLAGDDVVVPYLGNQKCPVSGEEKHDLGSFITVEGQKVFFCCNDCKPEGEKDPKATLAKAYPAGAVKDLKNAKCPVSGKDVAADASVVFQGHKVHLCCMKCAKKFSEKPVATIVKVMHPDTTDAGNEKCPVTGEPARDDVVVIWQKKVIHLANPGCVGKFKTDPARFTGGMK